MRITLLILGFCLGLFSLTSVASETVRVYQSSDTPHEAFILFYMASCPHCRRFDPIVKQYASDHHLPVLAFTLDGQSLPSFPKSLLPSQAEMNRFFPDGNPVVPTLFLMDYDQHKIIPVLKGEATMSQLGERLQQIHAVMTSHGY